MKGVGSADVEHPIGKTHGFNPQAALILATAHGGGAGDLHGDGAGCEAVTAEAAAQLGSVKFGLVANGRSRPEPSLYVERSLAFLDPEVLPRGSEGELGLDRPARKLQGEKGLGGIRVFAADRTGSPAI